jgi:undecaprenyl diphosphate synthase
VQDERKRNYDGIEMDIDSKFIVPDHVAIIMDGNGRWATGRGMPRGFGHKKGAEAFRRTVDACIEMSVPFVTFYAFSTENWKRPKSEINILFDLFESYLDEFADIHKRNARIIFIGDIGALSEKLVNKINDCVRLTENNTGTAVTIAVNYGGHAEIVNAVKGIIIDELTFSDIDERVFERYLYTAELPPVDLLIRTGGDKRVSNFLLWQLAYAELVFLDVFWPDFTKEDLIEAFRRYSTKERRFGSIKSK